MITTIILVRHGESDKNKNNPKRGLTKRGENMVYKTAQKIAALGFEGKAAILTTPYPRTSKSAQIIASYLGGLPITKKRGMRVNNFAQVEAMTQKGRDLTFFYFSVFESGKLPEPVSTPKNVAKGFLRLISEMSGINTLIIVGHGSALESFALYQKKYLPIKKLTKELKYAQFIVLKRNPNIKL